MKKTLLCENDIFNGIDVDACRKIFSRGQELSLIKGDKLKVSKKYVYLIKEGQLCSKKQLGQVFEAQKQSNFIFCHLLNAESSLPFLISKTNSTIIQIPIKCLKKHLSSKALKHISANVIKTSLKSHFFRKLILFNIQEKNKANFLNSIFLAICIVFFVNTISKPLLNQLSVCIETIRTFIFMLMNVFLYVPFVLHYKYNFKKDFVWLGGWKDFTILLGLSIAGSTLWKYCLVHFVPFHYFYQTQVFHTYLPLYSVFIYFICVIAQEFFARHVQCFLMYTMPKNKAISIVLSALVFSLSHYYLGLVFMAYTLVLGGIMSWFFAKYRAITPVILYHFILCTYCFYLLDFHSYLYKGIS
ncbi:CPBP family intramembrane metalloprotease [Gammaproteobacteria bacterium]|nr:CPBP family intramembrane metalloprotease [Gammaproteobacteria bacterium]